jgi:trans-aconitate methyltransferase
MEPNAPNFDSMARAYRWMEYFSFGPMLERCRFHFLTRCSHARHALVLGDGDGRFTARLLVSNPKVQVDAVDSSRAMLNVLRERVRDICQDADSRLSTTVADIRRFTPSRGDYDLVVSHFFLDCLTDAEAAALVERLTPHLTQGATWLASEFAVPTTGWRRLAARMVVRTLYFAFSFLTRLRVREIPNYATAFDDNGFRQVDKSAYMGGLLVAELWERRSE